MLVLLSATFAELPGRNNQEYPKENETVGNIKPVVEIPYPKKFPLH